MTLSSRVDALVSRLARSVRMPVAARLALEESAAAVVQAERMTSEDKRKMELAQKKNAHKGEKFWEEVTNQPTKDKHGNYVGFATFHWSKDSDKKKHSTRINVGSSPARLSIRSKDLVVKPQGGDDYVWGDEHEEKAKKAEGPTKDHQVKLDPHADENGDGVTDAARVGIPANKILPPPSLPKLPGDLPEELRKVEADFNEAIERDPEAMAKRYSSVVLESAKKKGEPPTFVTDDVKFLHPSYLPEGLGPKDVAPQEVMDWRAKNHVALHQGSNAVAKRAFLSYLDELAKLPEGDPKRSVLVTSGGCGAGKGFAVKNGPGPVKQLKDMAGAIWDAAGEQNSTENPWILEEAKKRGLKAHFLFVDADPVRQWDHPDLGVVARAAKPGEEGRMVDARLFADSYALGAKNFKAFHDKFKDDENAGFTFINTWDMAQGKDKEGKPLVDKEGKPKLFPVIKQVDGLDDRAMKLTSDDLYAKATDKIQKSAPTQAIRDGATIGQKAWGPPKAGEKSEGEKAAAAVEVNVKVIAAEDGLLKDLQKRLIENFKGNMRNLTKFFKQQEVDKREAFAGQGLKYDEGGKLVLKAPPSSGSKTEGSAVKAGCGCNEAPQDHPRCEECEQEAIQQTADNWQAEGCENYDDSQDVCLDDIVARMDLVTEAVAECGVSAKTKAMMEVAAAAVAATKYGTSLPDSAFADYGSMLNFLRSLKKGETITVFFKKGTSPIQRRALVVTDSSKGEGGGRIMVFFEDKKPIRRPLQVGGPTIMDYGPSQGLMFQPTMNQRVIEVVGLAEGDVSFLDRPQLEPEPMPTMKPASAKVEKALATALDASTEAAKVVREVRKSKVVDGSVFSVMYGLEHDRPSEKKPSGPTDKDKNLSPHDYKRKYGKCPPGYRADRRTGRCDPER